jgi:hypothetical protein
MSRLKTPLEPIGIPQEEFNEIFEEIEPIEEGGVVLKRYRFRPETGLQDGPILTEYRQKLIKIGKIERKPMKIPSSSLMSTNFEDPFGKDES